MAMVSERSLMEKMSAHVPPALASEADTMLCALAPCSVTLATSLPLFELLFWKLCLALH